VRGKEGGEGVRMGRGVSVPLSRYIIYHCASYSSVYSVRLWRCNAICYIQ
jgi:hypothetical protein